MAVKIKLRRTPDKHRLALLALLIAGSAIVLCAIVGFSVFDYYYLSYRGIVNQRLSQPIFTDTAKIYATPREVRPGQKLPIHLIANELREAGYTEAGAAQPSQLGAFRLGPNQITVSPGPESYHAPDPATIHVSGGIVDSIVDAKGQPLASYELEPLLITGLSAGEHRVKRRLLTYNEIPPNLRNAVLAIEDRRFFEHGGVNYESMASWAWHDMIGDRKHVGGASTLTMQLAKMLFLSDNRTIEYKIKEIAVAFQLEHRFTKQEIFQIYANEINLGQRGSFSIDGFGEAAHAYFGKDVHQLDLAECALLAGMIQSPNRLNPFRHPGRALRRRDVVLDAMVETGAITKDRAETAKLEPLHLVPGSVAAGEAPYFVDLVRDKLVRKLGDRDFNREGLRIYTSLDPDLERIATDAIDSYMPTVDKLVDRVHARDRRLGRPYVYPQVALVAIDPRTGKVLALVGGRNYGASQLNHAIAERPTGSTFKPFVYAAAFETATEGILLPGQTKLFSPLTMLNDAQVTYGAGTPYQYTPRNFEGEYYGEITARYALMRSDNNATISLGSMVGFDKVAALGRDAGIVNARGTPSVALGSYDATPIEVAGAYTIFDNGGIHLDPWMLASVRAPNGDIIADYSPTARTVLDPRVAFLTTSMMEAVLQGNGGEPCKVGGRDYCGTGAGVRNMGFSAPAAGKTGTDHDAWFAGFTTNLICVVWVGNDDYTPLDPENRGRIQGAQVAAPIWANFMKQAVQLPEYSDVHDFTPPAGVQIDSIDRVTGLLSDAACPDSYQAAFLDGTAPTETCDHEGEHRNLFQRMFGLGGKSSN